MDTVGVFGIGSTNFRYAAATPDGTLHDISVEPTRPHGLSEQLCAAISELQDSSGDTLDAVSIATTGLADSDGGAIRKLDTPAGDTVESVDVRSEIQRNHDLPVVLENDCSASALGEWQFGARNGHSSVVHVTFGTGIGGGLVEDGQLVSGEHTQAGEFGLIPVAPNAELESTGVRGAWEAFCSGRGIPQFASHLAETEIRGSTAAGGIDHSALNDDLASQVGSGTLDAKSVFQAFEEGDAFAATCLDRVARMNAAGIASICNTVNPGLITLGGGVALNNPDWIRDGIDTYLDDYLFVERPEIKVTQLRDDIGLYGALATALDRGVIGRTIDGRQATQAKVD